MQCFGLVCAVNMLYYPFNNPPRHRKHLIPYSSLFVLIIIIFITCHCNILIWLSTLYISNPIRSRISILLPIVHLIQIIRICHFYTKYQNKPATFAKYCSHFCSYIVGCIVTTWIIFPSQYLWHESQFKYPLFLSARHVTLKKRHRINRIEYVLKQIQFYFGKMIINVEKHKNKTSVNKNKQNKQQSQHFNMIESILINVLNLKMNQFFANLGGVTNRRRHSSHNSSNSNIFSSENDDLHVQAIYSYNTKAFIDKNDVEYQFYHRGMI